MNAVGVAGGTTGDAPDRVPRRDLLSKQDFFRLLAAQLQYQNPFSPGGDTEFLSQMLQFTVMETLQQIDASVNSLNQKLEALQKTQQEAGLSAALNLLGRRVSVLPPGGQRLEGQVSGIRLKDGLPVLLVGEQEVHLGWLEGVR